MKKLPLFRIAVHILAWVPAAWLAWDYFAGNLSVNPIQDLEQRLGKYALVLLLFSLAATPANTVFGFRPALQVRRALGLYAFMYASMHVFTFLVLDFAFDWGAIAREILEKLYIWYGVGAFLILSAMAATSFKSSQRRMGKSWKRLHRLVYIAGPMVIVHFAWASKGDLARLAGDIVQPLIFGLILTLLLVLRISSVRKEVSNLRSRFKHKSHPPHRVAVPQIQQEIED